jgi:hypothetical protein
MAMIGGMILVVGFFTEAWVIAVGAVMLALGIYSATR